MLMVTVLEMSVTVHLDVMADVANRPVNKYVLNRIKKLIYGGT
jgi:hypothetical protein